jgi:hypothetical protein
MIMLLNSLSVLLKRFLKYLIAVIAAAGFLSILARPRVNPYLGKSLQAIIPKDREGITLEDLQKLNRQQLVGVFHQLVSPEVSEMRGEYRAMLLDSGNAVNRFLSMLFLYFTWGMWLHKAFEPLSERHGHGYNTFLTTLPKVPENVFLAGAASLSGLVRSAFGSSAPQRMVRMMCNKTFIGPSVFDRRTSFHLFYKDYNSFYTSTMKDEVRKVNDTLYLGLGRLTITLGKINPFPFVLMGPPEPWVGPDDGFPAER